MTEKGVDKADIEQSKAALLDDTNKEEDEAQDVELPYKEAFMNLWRPARWMILNALLHPTYTIINAIVLGHQENEKMLAGLGLGSLTIGICALSIGSNCNSAVGTFISNAHGQNEPRQCQVYRNKAIFTVSVLYLILLIPLLFINRIYEAMGQDAEMAAYATEYVHYTIPFIYFYYISQVYQSFAQN